MSKMTNAILAGVFMTGIWLPFLGSLVDSDNTVSKTENRRLAEFPTLAPITNNLTDYPRHVETFFNDHFGFRKILIRWYHIVKVLWLGISVSDKVVVGNNGWLFYAGEGAFSDYRNAAPLSPHDLQRWKLGLEAKRDWLAHRGIRYLFVIAPEKHSIYPEHMPTWVNRIRDISRADQLVHYLQRQTDLPVLDLRPLLRKAKTQNRLYHKTDTHWNAFGASIAASAIVHTLSSWFPDITPHLLSDRQFTVKTTPGGDLSTMLDLRDHYEEERIIPIETVGHCAQPAEIHPPTQFFRQPAAWECRQTTHRALLFRDSYATAMLPYLSEHFQRIASVWLWPSGQALAKWVEQEIPDVVIEERVERYLQAAYIPQIHPFFP